MVELFVINHACPSTGQAVKPRTAVRINPDALANRACLAGLRDMDNSLTVASGAGLAAAGINTTAMAKSAVHIRGFHQNCACALTYATAR
ncbi:MAG: hypothetical protein HQ553_14345 [Chloroflexi bacterium]|nr:hypothetical protein [Chloroflexota bacterium]